MTSMQKKYKLIFNGNKNKDKSPCEFLYKQLSNCMKNSDDNIIACQDLRNNYENCLRKHNKPK